MQRRDTTLESEGAEFLVLGQLLLHRIPAYKTYTNMPGYDLVATNPDSGKAARIQVKSRWPTGAGGFLIKNVDCEFVVAVLLNRGTKKSPGNIRAPDYYVLPAELIRSVHREEKMPKVAFRDIEDIEEYRENWPLIIRYLAGRKRRKRKEE